MFLLSAPVAPDTSVVTGSTTGDAVLAVCLITATACVAIGVWEILARRSAVLLACCVGGLGCNIIEPFWDQLGHLWFNVGNNTAWTVFEHQNVPVHYPWWAVALYIQFGGFECFAFYLMFSRGARPRTFWMFCGWQAVCNLLIEIPLIQADVYQYYGEQPFKAFGLFPLHWLFINGVGVATIAVVLHRVGHRFTGAGVLWFLAIPGTAQIAAFSVALPAFSLYNTEAASEWKWLASAATMLLGAATLHGLSKLVPTTSAGPVTGAADRAPAAVGSGQV